MKASSSASELVMNSCLDSEEAEEPSMKNQASRTEIIFGP